MANRRMVVSSAEATLVTKQHVRPCDDCPWRRDAMPGWLGDRNAQEWVTIAHADLPVECHTRESPSFYVQCAGISIYRANICKKPRIAGFLALGVEPLKVPADRDAVFASPTEFREYHEKGRPR